MSAVVTTTSTEWDWVPQQGLGVQQDVFYRFVILAPSSMSQDEVYSYLSSRGWDLTSISAPPASILAALQAVIAIFPGATPPQSVWVEATWRGASTTLPQPDGSLYYEALQFYAQVPTTDPGGSTTPPPSGDVPGSSQQPAPASPWPVLLVGGVLVLGSWLLLKDTAKDPIPYARPRRARANPLGVLQTIRANVNGRPVKFDVATDGMTWTATADIKAGRRRRIVGSGGSKSEALQSAISLASAAFASADARA
jgi:hypothetical protein